MHRIDRSKAWFLAPLTIALVVATTFTPVHAASLEGKACKILDKQRNRAPQLLHV
jgi:hypothetical protein